VKAKLRRHKTKDTKLARLVVVTMMRLWIVALTAVPLVSAQYELPCYLCGVEDVSPGKQSWRKTSVMANVAYPGTVTTISSLCCNHTLLIFPSAIDLQKTVMQSLPMISRIFLDPVFLSRPLAI
jgi:hypothetical protein